MRSLPLSALALVLAACAASDANPSPRPPASRTPSAASSSAASSSAASTSAASTRAGGSTAAPRTAAADTMDARPATDDSRRRGASAGSSSAAMRGAPANDPCESTATCRSNAALRIPQGDSAIVRALYINRFAAQSWPRMRRYLAIADSTEINAMVIDVKDEFGLNFRPADSALARNAGGMAKIPNLRALVDTLTAHGVLPIARMVLFKDSVAARMNPTRVIRTTSGAPWRDKQGLTWVNPYDRDIWEYNIRVAEEMARAGFREIQFDYVRFPEPYRSLPPQAFPGANGRSKPQAIAEFLRAACPRIRALGARCTADIFGLVTTVKGPLEVGQEWEQLAPVADVLLPMVYPSHYPPGSFGVKRPNADPYTIIRTAISRARERDGALGIGGTGHVRPWLQAFSLGKPPYGAAELEAQKRAVYDAGYQGWVLWNPGSKYEAFLPALARGAARREASRAER